MSLVTKESFALPFTIMAAALSAAYLLAQYGFGLFDATIKDLIAIAPYITFSAAGTLALVYSRVRIFMVVVTLTAMYWILNAVTGFVGTTWQKNTVTLLYTGTTIIGPLLVAVYSCWFERGDILFFILKKVALLAVVVLVFWLGFQYYSLTFLKLITANPFPSLLPSWLTLSAAAFVAFLVALLALITLQVKNRSITHGTLALTIVGLFAVCQTLSVQGALPMMMTVIGASLLAALVHETYTMAFVDQLTNLLGRRALEERMSRLGKDFTIAMIDIDHFKKFNDTYGHDAGDQVLRLVAAQIQKVTGGGKAYRYGGEEFTILFPNKNINECKVHLEAVRENIANYQVELRDDSQRPKSYKLGFLKRGSQKKRASKKVSVTISIGAAMRSKSAATPESVIKLADQSLYQAKEAGRNCTKLHLPKSA